MEPLGVELVAVCDTEREGRFGGKAGPYWSLLLGGGGDREGRRTRFLEEREEDKVLEDLWAESTV